MEFHKCPRCGGQVNRTGQSYICSCGWNTSYNPGDKQSQKNMVLFLFLTTGLIAGVLFHLFQWGGHSLSVIFAGNSDMVKICMDLKKYDCVENSYRKLYEKTGDLKYLAELGKLQFKRERYSNAGETYGLYFSKGGEGYEAAYYYAHALAKTNRVDSSIKYFESILRSKPNVVMITVVESYLQVLMANNRRQKAQEVLTWVKKVSRNSINTVEHIRKWERRFKIKG